MKNTNPPIAFISYSWDSNDHKNWVLKLADFLIEKGGVDVILDQYELQKTGVNMPLFMERSIEKADKVIIIMTPEYKKKVEKREGGSGSEYSMITAELFEIQADNTKFLPVLRYGNKDASRPLFLKPFIYHDMTDDQRFESDAFKLARDIHDEPELVKPTLGAKPDFSNGNLDPVLEVARNISRDIDLQTQKEHLFSMTDTLSKTRNDIKEFFNSLQEKANLYNTNTNLRFAVENDSDTKCILRVNDISMYISFGISYSNYSLSNVDLLIKTFDKFIPLKNDPSLIYSNGNPQIIKSEEFKPIISDDLRVVWQKQKGKNIMDLNKLTEYCFSSILQSLSKLTS